MKFEGGELILGDCLDKMKDIPDQSIDLVLCDPPYGLTPCGWDLLIPFDEMWNNLERLIKPTGVILLFGTEPFSSRLRGKNPIDTSVNLLLDTVTKLAEGLK